MPSTRSRPLTADDDLEHHPLQGGASFDSVPSVATERQRDAGSPAPRRAERVTLGALNTLDWRQALGGGLIGLGMLGIVVAWFGVSGTLDPGEQMPYISSGGFGGSALIAIGVTLLVSFEHVRDREALNDVLDELDHLRHRLDAMQGPVARPSDNGS